MADSVREPRQERSIDKKNRIISAGYELFSEVGYFSTTTADIAKRAGVSTGIVYGYFKDKRDILLDVLDIYIRRTFEPYIEMFGKLSMPLDFSFLFPHVLDNAIETHKKNAKIHEVLHSLTNSDEAVNKKFLALEDEITMRFAEKFEELGAEIEHPLEKIHLAMDIVQSYSHECVYDKHDYLDYPAMRACVIRTLTLLFEK